MQISKLERLAEIANVAGGFIQLSQTIAGSLIDEEDNATAFMSFSYGVVDAMCQRTGLDKADSYEVLRTFLLNTFRGNEDKVENALAVIALLTSDEQWLVPMKAGGSAALQFLQSTTEGERFAACLALRKTLGGNPPTE